MSIFDEVMLKAAAISEEEMARAINRMGPPEEGEEVICVVTSELARRFWALAEIFDRQEKLAMHAARYDANNDEECRQFIATSRRMGAYEEFCRDAAWLEMRNEAGDKAWTVDTLAIRNGLTLCKSRRNEETIKLGSMSLDSVREALLRLTGFMEAKEEPPKGKPS